MKGSQIFRLKMGPEETERFQTFLMRESGLVFEGRRTREMEHAVAVRMIELGMSSFEEYFNHLANQKLGADELHHLVISLTVGETQFFRTPDQFAALRKYILPELIERKRNGDRSLTIVSAGCATGEEPYTLSLMLRELIPDYGNWNILIAGLDINQEFLRAAREGIYGERKMRLVDPISRQTYFERLSKNQWQVNDELSQNVKLSLFNITADDPLRATNGAKINLLLCRNVLIYFSAPTIKKVIAGFRAALADGGYLMLGYSESLFKINDTFQTIHTPEAFLYQKTNKAPVPVELPAPKYEPREREDFLKALGSLPHPKVEEVEEKKRLEEAIPGAMIAHLLSHAGDGETEPAKAGAAPRTSRPPSDETPEEELWEEGLKFFAEENFREAEARFDRMLRKNPRSSRAHLGLGLLHANSGAEQSAREFAEKAKSHDDLLPEIYFLLALLDERAGDLERAVQNYQRVLLLAADFAMAHFNLGNLYLKLGREREARRRFMNAIAVLERDHDNHSLRFSGGLSRDAVLSFCRMQEAELVKPHARRARAG